MGALVTLELSDDSPVVDLPWIITFGPLDEEDGWEPVVCGPYERPHALALAEAVVADDELMAVVEPLLPRVSVDEIRDEILKAQRGAAEEPFDELDDLEESMPGVDSYSPPPEMPGPGEVRAAFARIAARLAAQA